MTMNGALFRLQMKSKQMYVKKTLAGWMYCFFISHVRQCDLQLQCIEIGISRLIDSFNKTCDSFELY